MQSDRSVEERIADFSARPDSVLLNSLHAGPRANFSTISLLGMVRGHSDEPPLLGSGVFVRLADRYFVLTAGHVIQALFPDPKAQPLKPRGSSSASLAFIAESLPPFRTATAIATSATGRSTSDTSKSRRTRPATGRRMKRRTSVIDGSTSRLLLSYRTTTTSSFAVCPMRSLDAPASATRRSFCRTSRLHSPDAEMRRRASTHRKRESSASISRSTSLR